MTNIKHIASCLMTPHAMIYCKYKSKAISKGKCKPNTRIYSGSVTDLLSALLHSSSTQLESYFTRSTTSLLGGENLTIVAYTFTDTKLDVEFFTKGTTTPDSSFTRVQPLPLCFVAQHKNLVFYGTNT